MGSHIFDFPLRTGTWRDIARPIVQRVLQETQGQDEKVVKKALYDAYPFGERKFRPYQIWLAEIKAGKLVYRRKERWEQSMLLKDRD